jgi:glycosyltransferase 2 family protein
MHHSSWRQVRWKIRGAARSLSIVAAQCFASSAMRCGARVAIYALVMGFFAAALLGLTREALRVSWNFQASHVMLAVALLVLRGPLPAYGWWAILRHLGYALPWWRSVRIVYHSAVAGYLPGGAWHAVSRVIMAEQEGIPRATAVVSVAIESVLILLAALIVASLSLIAWPDPPLWSVAVGLFVLLIVLVRPDLYTKAIDIGLQRIGRKPLKIQLTRGAALRLLLPFALNWIVFGVIFWAIIAAMHPGFSVLMIPVVTGIFAAGWAGGYLAVVVPQGLGVRELIIATLMIAIGVPASVAIAGALIARLCSILGVGLWALVSMRL